MGLFGWCRLFGDTLGGGQLARGEELQQVGSGDGGGVERAGGQGRGVCGG